MSSESLKADIAPGHGEEEEYSEDEDQDRGSDEGALYSDFEEEDTSKQGGGSDAGGEDYSDFEGEVIFLFVCKCIAH